MGTISIDLNVKFIEILSRLVLEQNKQLLQIIADEEGIGYREINNFLPSLYQMKQQLTSLKTLPKGQGEGQCNLLEKSNSTSESSVSFSDPEVS